VRGQARALDAGKRKAAGDEEFVYFCFCFHAIDGKNAGWGLGIRG